jgi:hypothetical protein
MRTEYITESLMQDAGMELLVNYRATRLTTFFQSLNEQPENEWEIVVDGVELVIADEPINITKLIDEYQMKAIIEQLENYI